MQSLSFEMLVAGAPVKTEATAKESLDAKAMRVGYQIGKLESDRMKLEQERMQFQQQMASALQSLLMQQAQLASQQGAQAGAAAAMGAMSAAPPQMGGGMGMPMDAMMGGAPPPAAEPDMSALIGGAPPGPGMPM
jgi:hypothetical protein